MNKYCYESIEAPVDNRLVLDDIADDELFSQLSKLEFVSFYFIKAVTVGDSAAIDYWKEQRGHALHTLVSKLNGVS